MEQRRLRLGDILDDYCPRERRVTNHAVVAMIEEKVKQTRCTTCDTEHPYKGARVPKRRQKDTPASLYKDVLAGMPDVVDPPGAAEPVHDAPTASLAMPGDAVSDSVALPTADPDSIEEPQPLMQSDDNNGHDTFPSASSTPEASGAPSRDTASGPAAEDGAQRHHESSEERDGEAAAGSDGPVHRRLIRATLPRPEGQKDARPVPEFTVRHSPARNGSGSFRGGDRTRARGGQAGGPGEPNGNRAHGSHARFQGGRPSGAGRQSSGRAGGAAGFRGGHAGPKSRRGRGSR